MCESEVRKLIKTSMPDVPESDAAVDYIVAMATISAREVLAEDDEILTMLVELVDFLSSKVKGDDFLKAFTAIIKKHHPQLVEEIKNEHLKIDDKLDNPLCIADEMDKLAEQLKDRTNIVKVEETSKVDSRKLAKAEAKLQEKKDKRSNVPNIDLGAWMASPTVSQAIDRKDDSNVPDSQIVTAGGSTRDIRLSQIDLSIGSKELLANCDVTIAYGRRYGFVGRNGLGKTTLLKMIGSGQLKLPPGVSVLHVEQEVEGDDTLVTDAVLNSDKRRVYLLEQEKILQEMAKVANDSDVQEKLKQVYADIEAAELDKAPARAAAILSGLGFTSEEQAYATRVFSGGWRMRVALAQALFSRPDLLLLDEPTNMLDMKAVYWLESHLQSWPTTVVCVSHDRKFLNAISTDILHLHSKRIDTYRGNYDNFEKTKDEKLLQQQREYESQKRERAHVQEFIDKFRYNAKRASMVQSRIKALERMPKLVPVELDPPVTFKFSNNIEKLAAPVVQLDNVSFKYAPDRQPVFQDIDCNCDSDSRICIVGDNGAGKTTLLKLLMDQLQPTSGTRNCNRRVRIGYFAQHHVDGLGAEGMILSALQLMQNKFPGRSEDAYRSALASFGIDSTLASQPVVSLSGGQKSRLAFALIATTEPNMLILDEPTNHLDVDSVEALAICINKFLGGVVLVSHDERLIELVCNELWVVENRTVRRLEGGINEYRKEAMRQLQAQLLIQNQ